MLCREELLQELGGSVARTAELARGTFHTLGEQGHWINWGGQPGGVSHCSGEHHLPVRGFVPFLTFLFITIIIFKILFKLLNCC